MKYKVISKLYLEFEQESMKRLEYAKFAITCSSKFSKKIKVDIYKSKKSSNLHKLHS